MTLKKTAKPRLTPHQKTLICEAYEAGASFIKIAERFDVSPATVKKAVREKPPLPTPSFDFEKIALNEDIGVFVQQEHIMVRFPKKQLIEVLFRGLL